MRNKNLPTLVEITLMENETFNNCGNIPIIVKLREYIINHFLDQLLQITVDELSCENIDLIELLTNGLSDYETAHHINDNLERMRM